MTKWLMFLLQDTVFKMQNREESLDVMCECL